MTTLIGKPLGFQTTDVIVSFETIELRSMCSSLDAAERELGVMGARALFAIISEMEAVDTAHEFLEQAMDDATISEERAVEVAVGNEHRATLVPVGVRYRNHSDKSVDWSTVRYLKLVGVCLC